MPGLTLGISPCPNDTYIFEALIHKRIPCEFNFDLHMADVEDLNGKALAGVLDVTKLSAAVMSQLLEEYVILDSGAALGRGCGPLLVGGKNMDPLDLKTASIAIPGVMTTANTLLSLNGSFIGPRHEMIFNEVIPAVADGRVDLGVIIHEGRFIFGDYGLKLVLDLGEWWERTTGLPIPLGVIAVKRELGKEKALAVQDAIRRSVIFANDNPGDCMFFLKEHASEMDEGVMLEHVKMFVTDFSIELGEEGRETVRAFLKASNPNLPDLPVFADDMI